MSNKLVSVITPSYGRKELLVETIKNVRAQTHRPIEHIIVPDGPPSPEWWNHLAEFICRPPSADYSIRLVTLGRYWTAELDDSYAAAPMAVGQLVAAGDYQCWLADDERMTPDHISELVTLLEREKVDFVYPFVAYYKNGDKQPIIIGNDPPRKNAVTHTLYRHEMINLGKGPYRTHAGRTGDWEQVKRWIDAGATWAMLDKVTLSHRDDAGIELDSSWSAPLPDWASP